MPAIFLAAALTATNTAIEDAISVAKEAAEALALKTAQDVADTAEIAQDALTFLRAIVLAGI